MSKETKKTTSNQAPLITKDMTVGDMVAKYPRTVNVMMAHGLHCIGCAANPFETVENGALGHGMSQDETKSLVEELNKAASAPARPKNGIFFTENAIAKIKELAVAEKKQDQTLKIEVTPQGCDNWDYFMDFSPKPAGEEREVTIAGLKVFISPASEKALQGGEIDYLVTPEGEGFKIDNPNKPDCNCKDGKCECGEEACK